MPVHSGKLGVVNGKSTVQNWSISDEQNLAAAVASNTALGRVRRPGVNSWSGNYAQKGGTPPVMPGETFSFVGYTAPTDNVSGNGLKYTGDAVVKSVAISWNWASGEIIGSTTEFDGHLALAAADGTQIADITAPDVPTIALAKIQFSADDTTFTDVANVTTVTLTITNDVQAYVNSSTVVSNTLWTGQRAGNYDWNMAIAMQDVKRTDVVKGTQYSWKIFVDATTFWKLKWGRVKNFTGLTVDRDSGAIIAQTVNVEMDGTKESDGVLGHILKPGGTQFWPPAFVPLS